MSLWVAVNSLLLFAQAAPLPPTSSPWELFRCSSVVVLDKLLKVPRQLLRLHLIHKLASPSSCLIIQLNTDAIGSIITFIIIITLRIAVETTSALPFQRFTNSLVPTILGRGM